MTDIFNWLASHESGLSAIAALIAIIAGIAVLSRLVWTRMPGRLVTNVKRPAFLADWRNIALVTVTFVALILAVLMASNEPDAPNNPDTVIAATKITGKPSVAVLPLNSLSNDPEQTYLADGITEDVITLLSRNPRFFVIARNSSFTYRDRAVDVRQVGEELGVRYVVEGSVRKMGERLRVTVQLIDSHDGQHLWAEQYDRPVTKIFAVQDEITNGIAVALGDEIFSAEIARASNTSTNNLDAWGLVMRASQGLVSYNSQSTKKAVSLLRDALALDPDYALAKAELSRLLCFRAADQFSDNPGEDVAKAYALGEQALRASPNDPLVLSAVGSCFGATGRSQEGIRLLKKALTRQPNFAMALGFLGMSYIFDEQSAQGLPYLEQALLLSPLSPYVYFRETMRGIALNELGRYEEGEQVLRRALESYDGWWLTWLQLAVARAGQGDIEGAKQALYTARKKEAMFSLAFYRGSAAQVYKNKGKNFLALLEPIWPANLLTTNKH